MLSVFLMQFACARRPDDPLALHRLTSVVGGAVSSSYFRSAGRLLAEGLPSQPRWLATYPAHMHELFLHAQNKPPGLVLIHMPLIQYFGFNEVAALLAGLCMAALTPLCVPAVYCMLRALTHDRKSAFHGAALLAFMPALLLLFPAWDQTFPIFTAALVALWARAVDTGRWPYAILFALCLAITTFFTFNLLVLGLFLAGYAAAHFCLTPTPTTALRLIRLSTCAIGTFIALYTILFLTTGYNPLATLHAGLINQHELERTFLKRPYPITIPFDILDFLLGTGWIATVAIGFYLHRQISSRHWRSPGFIITTLVIGQILILAATGLLTVETARVWMFLIPLFLIPAALEISRWTPKARLVIYLSLLCIVIALTLNMRFVAV
jgi:hypothetical protein